MLLVDLAGGRPTEALLVVAVFGLGHLIWGWKQLLPWFHLALGAAYAFHVTLTWHILQTRQTDITNQGRFFSAVIIFLGNIAVLLVGVPLLTTRVGALTALGWWFQETGDLLHRLRGLL